MSFVPPLELPDMTHRRPFAGTPFASRLSKPERRRFLKWLGVATAVPALAPSLRQTLWDAALGKAGAQDSEQTYFVEICLRDQLDFGHVMVAPGLARHTGLRRGERGRQCALFYEQDELREEAPGVFLTPQSLGLAPHLEHVAMMELGELTDGPVHGHEAANPLRSPGRTRTAGGGRVPMWEAEPGGNNSEGAFHTSTPTPLALHNWWQRQLQPDLHNGVVIKGTSRDYGMYHCGAGLPGSEPDRYQNAESLYSEFPATTVDRNVLPERGEAELVTRFLRHVDPRFLQGRGYSTGARDAHLAQLEDHERLLHVAEPRVVDLRLSEEEVAYWSDGTPDPYGRQDIAPWEEAAWAFKLIDSGIVRSVGYEVDIGDIHGERTQPQMRDQTMTTVGPLVRLIEQFKAAGIWDQTLIAVSTTDGGRSPGAGSSGDQGKNGYILAGGKIRGGYYGDIRVAGDSGDGHEYSYHRPDGGTGVAIAGGTTGNDQRVEAAPLWRTIAQALRVPSDALSAFPDVADARPFDWLLRD